MKTAHAIATVLGTLTVMVSAHGAGPIDPAKGCKTNPELVGSCFALRGRIFPANGAYPMRIWPVGSKRYLAVLPAEEEIAPQAIKERFSFDKDIFTDLVVCPFSKQRAGEIQFVCIESARRVKVVPNGR